MTQVWVPDTDMARIPRLLNGQHLGAHPILSHRPPDLPRSAILDTLDGVEEQDRYRYRGDPPWLPPKDDDDGMPTTQEIAGIGGWG